MYQFSHILGLSFMLDRMNSKTIHNDLMPGIFFRLHFNKKLILRRKLDSLRWFSQLRNRTAHWGRGAHPGGYDQLRTRPRFLYNAPTPKFHRHMFTRSEVIVLTNKYTHTHTHTQTDAAENTQRSSLRYDVKPVTLSKCNSAITTFICFENLYFTKQW